MLRMTIARWASWSLHKRRLWSRMACKQNYYRMSYQLKNKCKPKFGKELKNCCFHKNQSLRFHKFTAMTQRTKNLKITIIQWHSKSSLMRSSIWFRALSLVSCSQWPRTTIMRLCVLCCRSGLIAVGLIELVWTWMKDVKRSSNCFFP